MMEGQPIRWQVCFSRAAETPLARLVPGRFKHVRAFGFVPVQEVWIFYDVTLAGTTIVAARDRSATADRMIAAWIHDSEVVAIERQGVRRAFPCGFWCVTAIKHLLGLRTGALRPDALWRDLVRHGAKTLDGREGTPDAGTAAARSCC